MSEEARDVFCFQEGRIILLTRKINLEGVRHLLCVEEREFKLDKHLGRVRVV